MKEYEVPVLWEVMGTVKVKADSLEKAEEQALQVKELPDSDFIQGSLQIDRNSSFYEELVEKENKE